MSGIFEVTILRFCGNIIPLLPNNVVMAENTNIFKNRLDKFWSSYDFVYLFRAQPLDTGSVK